MEQNDLFSSLLNDPEKLKGVLSMASSLLGGEQEGSASAAPPEPPAPAAAPTVSAPPSARPRVASSGYDPSAELMQRVMPVIAEITKSGQSAVSREKLNLLNAVKPFVADNVGSQIDHGLRLVSIARMARTAMRQVGGQIDSGASKEGVDHV